MKIKYFSRSDKGSFREKNEDYIGIYVPPVNSSRIKNDFWFVIADGVGGGQCGELASEMAIKLLIDHIQTDCNNVKTHISNINFVLRKFAQNNDLKQFGTTLTVLHLQNNEYKYYHIGDSRIYQIKKDSTHQITIDDTPIEQKSIFGKSSQPLLQAVGVTKNINIQYGDGKLSPGAYYLLTTDGLFEKTLDPIKVLKILRKCNFAKVLDNLIEYSRERGSRDNISMIIIYVKHRLLKVYLTIVIVIIIMVMIYYAAI